MMDLMRIAAALLGGYVALMGFAIILIKVIFPFLTKEEMKRLKITQNQS